MLAAFYNFLFRFLLMLDSVLFYHTIETFLFVFLTKLVHKWFRFLCFLEHLFLGLFLGLILLHLVVLHWVFGCFRRIVVRLDLGLHFGYLLDLRGGICSLLKFDGFIYRLLGPLRNHFGILSLYRLEGITDIPILAYIILLFWRFLSFLKFVDTFSGFLPLNSKLCLY